MERRGAGTKRCLVTGANTGIGYAIAKGLAEAGAEVVLLCRNGEKAAKAREALVAQTGNTQLHTLHCDLSSQASIRSAAASFVERFAGLDVLVNNAGALPFARCETVDGIEQLLAVNYLGAFLLTHLLLDALERRAPARVVNVVGRLHFRGTLHLDDLQLTRGYNTLKAGMQAVLAKTSFTFALDERVKERGIRANCFHPGGIKSQLTRHAPWYLRWAVWLASLRMESPEVGAAPGVFLALDPSMEGKGGMYFDQMKPTQASQDARDPQLAARLWEQSCVLVGLPSASR